MAAPRLLIIVTLGLVLVGMTRAQEAEEGADHPVRFTEVSLHDHARTFLESIGTRLIWSEELEVRSASTLRIVNPVEAPTPPNPGRLFELLQAEQALVFRPGSWLDSPFVLRSTETLEEASPMQSRLLRPASIRLSEQFDPEYVCCVLPLVNLDCLEISGLANSMLGRTRARVVRIPSANALFLAGPRPALRLVIRLVDELETRAALAEGALEADESPPLEEVALKPDSPLPDSRPWPFEMGVSLARCLERGGELDERRYDTNYANRFTRPEPQPVGDDLPDLGPALDRMLQERLLANDLIYIRRRDVDGRYLEIHERTQSPLKWFFFAEPGDRLTAAELAREPALFVKSSLPSFLTVWELHDLVEAALSHPEPIKARESGRLLILSTAAELIRFRQLLAEVGLVCAGEVATTWRERRVKEREERRRSRRD